MISKAIFNSLNVLNMFEHSVYISAFQKMKLIFFIIFIEFIEFKATKLISVFDK